jgi:hypothetical protein
LPLYPSSVCREEEGEFPVAGGWPPDLRQIRSREVKSSRREGDQPIGEDEEVEEFLETGPERFWSEKAFLRIMDERKSILADEKLTARQKKQLLETSCYPLTVATGRPIPFKTEEVVRWMLTYTMAVVVILAVLTAFFNFGKRADHLFHRYGDRCNDCYRSPEAGQDRTVNPLLQRVDPGSQFSVGFSST